MARRPLYEGGDGLWTPLLTVDEETIRHKDNGFYFSIKIRSSENRQMSDFDDFEKQLLENRQGERVGSRDEAFCLELSF